jgi:hypothetical protein
MQVLADLELVSKSVSVFACFCCLSHYVFVPYFVLFVFILRVVVDCLGGHQV